MFQAKLELSGWLFLPVCDAKQQTSGKHLQILCPVARRFAGEAYVYFLNALSSPVKSC